MERQLTFGFFEEDTAPADAACESHQAQTVTEPVTNPENFHMVVGVMTPPILSVVACQPTFTTDGILLVGNSEVGA